MEKDYQPQKIESAAQHYWQEKNLFQVTEDINQEKYYCLTMLPYPSGHLHMGHVRIYTIGDVITRYQMMMGKNVLQPMGWDAFGLPAENAAIKHQTSPADWTKQNIAHMKQQMQEMGFGYDWNREFATCDPDYYRWEQWLFIKLFQKGLIYRKDAMVNWDPVDQTVLANEQVIDGKGWRSGAPVERKSIPQWFFKITAYADELLEQLDHLPEWPEQVKIMQRNWIGRSHGLNIIFKIKDFSPLTVYTTRPDTLFGVTYLALAPTHPIVKKISQTNPAVKKFVETCKKIKVAEEDMATLKKEGMPLNINAIHPITGDAIPVWVANFVLMGYAEGALMSVPAHDERDFEFAHQYDLPIKPVIAPADGSEWDYQKKAFTEPGVLINSLELNGLSSEEAQRTIADRITEKKLGSRQTHYRLRDWGVSRQRYWGTPIPIIYCPQCGTVPVPEKDLPVELPLDVDFKDVTSPLKTLDSFLNTQCPSCGGPATRETDTFDTFVESSWYYARYASKKQNKAMLDGRANYWLPVDQYIGGIEHAVLHLLYARFFHKIMRDEGLVNSDEPFTRLLTQGMVLNQSAKMSKSKGNVVDPHPLVEKYGADTVRLFMMFAAPPDQSLEWSDSGVEGSFRFLKRLWSFASTYADMIRIQNRLPAANELGLDNWENVGPDQKNIFRQVYELLEQAKIDYERRHFNTIVSSCMKMLNLLSKVPESKPGNVDIKEIIIHRGLSILLRLLAPITPHMTHQLWLDLDYQGIILEAPWPKGSPIVFQVDQIEWVVQVNGKLRSRVMVPSEAEQKMIEDLVKKDEKIKQYIKDKTIKKIITVPGKLINIVVK